MSLNAGATGKGSGWIWRAKKMDEQEAKDIAIEKADGDAFCDDCRCYHENKCPVGPSKEARYRAVLGQKDAAIRKLLGVMDMQEKRETEEFHIPQKTAWFMWNEAKELAAKALEEN
jgi:hypothetical protein